MFYDTIDLQPQCLFLLLSWSVCPLPYYFLNHFSACPYILLVHAMLHLCGVMMNVYTTPFIVPSLTGLFPPGYACLQPNSQFPLQH